MTNLIVFHNEVTCLMDKGRVADVIYLKFSEALNTVSVNSIIEKLIKYVFGK